ncbi:FeoA domain-containing protein [Synechocystis sp. PCC 7339]|uniref:FeoA family protein n=1 Tax=Synechocystis sp. PCC 7339 TaxID=2782213 RepID=UPI001CBC128C|nr:FeoA domain-containing protein [Synechocystis sp. PCC 7339]
MTLLDLSVGQVAFVEKILLGNHGEGLVNRMEAMGIIPDKPIQLLRKASLGGHSTSALVVPPKWPCVAVKPNWCRLP